MNNQINALLLEAVNNISREKNIPREVIAEFLIDSIKKAYAKSTYEDNIEVNFDLSTGELNAYKLYTVVEDSDEYDEFINILNTDPKVINAGLNLGDVYKEAFDITKEFKHQVVQGILQSFKQKIIEISNHRVYESWSPMINTVIMAEIEKEDKKGNFFTINLENQYDSNNVLLEPTLGFVGRKELNPLEKLDVSQKYHFVVTEVKEQSKFCPVILSRASAKLVEYYMGLEIPEIDDGSIQIVKSARVAGVKTKVLVQQKAILPIDAASICVGPKGSRVKTISKLIGGEKVEIINWSDDREILIASLLDRTKVLGMKFLEEGDQKHVQVIANENDVVMLIGKRAANVKLATNLSGYSIELLSVEDAQKLNIDYKPFHWQEQQFKLQPMPTFNNNDVEELLNDEDIEILENNEEFDELNEAFKAELEKALNDK